MSVATLLPFAHGGGHSEPVDLMGWLVPVLLLTIAGGVYLAGVSPYHPRLRRHWSRWRTAS